MLAGSLPPGAPAEWYAELVGALSGTGARVAVDTSDEPLRALVERLEVGAPHLMKPNGHELASLTGHDGDALENDPAAAARAALRAGRPRRRERAGHARRQRRRPRDRRPCLARARRPRPRSSAPSARATPASSATCSPRIEGREPGRPARPRRRLRQRRRRAARHHHPPPPPRGPHPGPGQPTWTSRKETDPCPTSSPPRWCASTPRSASTKDDVIRALAGLVGEAGRSHDVDQLVTDAFAREQTSATGLAGGIAIPHCRTDRRRGADAGLRPARARGRLRRQGRPGRPGLPDRGARPAATPTTCRSSPSWRAPWSSPPSPTSCAGRSPTRPSSTWSAASSASEPSPPPHLRPPLPPARLRRRRPRRHRPPGPADRAAWSRSPRARPASPTPTWPPRRCRAPPSGPASTSRSRPRARPAPPRSPTTPSPRADAVIFAVDVGVRDRGRFGGKPVVTLGREAPDRRGRRDDRRGAPLRRRPERAPRSRARPVARPRAAPPPRRPGAAGPAGC